MARRGRQQDDDLLMDDELAAAFLGDDDDQSFGNDAAEDDQPASDDQSDWIEENDAAMPGQLALDVFETNEKLIVRAPIAGVSKEDLELNITDNTLSITGERKAGGNDEGKNFYLQECYWGEFARSITLPVAVKEEEIEALLKDGVLTVKFEKVKQDVVRKIEIRG